MPNQFDFDHPLHTTTLVEASAGTGKTFTIERLVLQFLIQPSEGEPIDISEILVVTFTKAATQELKDRIRKLLVVSLEQGYLDVRSQQPFSETELHLLNQALLNFDNASIYTIHGFCQYMLKEFPFYSQNLFDAQVNNHTDVEEVLMWDYFRKYLYDVLPEQYQAFYNQFISNQAFPDALKQLTHYYANAYFAPDQTRIIPEPTQIDQLVESLNTMQAEDAENSRESYLACSLLMKIFTFLNKTSLERKWEQGELTFNDLILLLRDALLKNPEQAETLRHAIQKKYKAILIDEFQDTDPVQWEIFQRLFFNNTHKMVLVGDPKQSIYSFRGADVQTYMFVRDVIQLQDIQAYRTLTRNYRSKKELLEGLNILFKEAAEADDTFDFFPAEAGAHEKAPEFTVDHTSVPPIEMMAVKDGEPGVTKGEAQELLFKYITNQIYTLIEPIQSVEEKESKQTETPNEPTLSKPHTYLLNGNPIQYKDIAVLVSTNRHAQEVFNMLTAKGIPAVLSKQYTLFQTDEAYHTLQILAAIQTPSDPSLIKCALMGSYFEMKMQRVLYLEASGTLDFWQEQFQSWNQDLNHVPIIQVLQTMLAFVHEDIEGNFYTRNLARELGERKITNVLHILEILHGWSITYQAGLEHLYQILYQHIHHPDKDEDEYLMRLDRESDAVQIMTLHAAKGLEFPIVFLAGGLDGVHTRSSYYEYYKPIKTEVSAVPQKQDASKTLMRKQKIFDFLKQGDEPKELHKQQEIQEGLRRLYVAMTRAQSRLYIPFVCLSQGKDITLLTWYEALLSEGFYKKNAKGFQQLQQKIIQAYPHLFSLQKIPKDFSIDTLPPLPQPNPYSQVQLRIPELNHASTFPLRFERILSFTSVMQQQKTMLTMEDHRDTQDGETEEDTSPESMQKPSEEDGAIITPFNLKGSSKMGNMLHDLLEHIDYQCIAACSNFSTFSNQDAITELILEAMIPLFPNESQRIASLPAVQQILWNTLRSRIPIDQEQTIQLASLSSENRSHELEFMLPVIEEKARAKLPLAGMEKQGIRIQAGYLHGYIDLVFMHNNRYYILDWKSNWLGARIDDYNQAGMNHALEHHGYRVQYYMYVTALYSILKQLKNSRIHSGKPDFSYERDIGGVIYAFLRGIPEPSEAPCTTGIFFDKPSLKSIQEFSKPFVKGGIV